MKSKLKNLLKNSQFFYLCYYYVASCLLKFFGLFIKTNEKSAIFVCYGGARYDDSPRFVYQYMKNDSFFKDWNLVWAFNKPDKFSNIENKVKIDTLEYFKVALSSGFWITNSSVSRGLNFQKKNTKCFVFDHGTVGLKRLGSDIAVKKNAFIPKFTGACNEYFVQGILDLQILPKSRNIDKKIFKNFGLPRNDNLINISKEEVHKIKKFFGIPLNKKVILYTTTFREENVNKKSQNYIDIPLSFDKWENVFGDDYVMLVTVHYEISKIINKIPNNSFVYTVTQFDEINDLLKISDIMISDYSSIVFDYSILKRPIFCYAYDYEEYKKNRGFYTDPNDLFSHGAIKKEDELIGLIKNIDYKKEQEWTEYNIRNKFLKYYDGKSCERCMNYIKRKYL